MEREIWKENRRERDWRLGWRRIEESRVGEGTV